MGYLLHRCSVCWPQSSRKQPLMWCVGGVGVHVGACDVVQVRGSLSEGLALETLPREGISMRMPPGPKHFASSSGQTGHPYRGHMRFETARISRITKSTLTTCAITKRPVPGLPAHSSRQTAQTSAAARSIIALMRRWNFPTSASAHVASERVTCRASLCGAQDFFRRQN